MATPAATALTAFGFTSLESEIYAFLLGSAPATGYRVAQAIGKPVANTYKALETLEAKGAIQVDSSENRLCRAVPADELLSRLSREFESRRREAHEAFGKLKSTGSDERIYSLKSAEQAVQRARTMLSEAARVAMVAASPRQIETLRSALEAAVARGVDVTLRTHAPVVIDGIEVAIVPDSEDELALAVDEEQSLIAVLDGENAQGIWTRNPVLARSQHRSLSAQYTLALVRDRVNEGAGPKRLARALGTLR